VLALLANGGAAAKANGVNLVLDANAVASFDSLLNDIKKIKPQAANPPAGLPTTA
jgi:hypothetical protein